MIRVENVSISFGNKQVLKDLSIEIQNKETVVILGRSGIGKSVLFKCITGLLQPDSGRIFVDNVETTNCNHHALQMIRRRMGFLFQEGALFDSMPVFDNIAFPMRQRKKYSESEIRKRVIHYAELVELGHALDVYPRELSGGMKRKAALARAIIHQPDYLFYDEPTTGLDPSSSAMVDILIKRLADELKLTSVVITHDIELAAFVATRVAWLEDKRIQFYDKKEKAFEDGSFIKQGFLTSRERVRNEASNS